MTKTATQNRPYTAEALPVRATLVSAAGNKVVLEFDWNNREQVRHFAHQSDICIRSGGQTMLAKV